MTNRILLIVLSVMLSSGHGALFARGFGGGGFRGGGGGGFGGGGMSRPTPRPSPSYNRSPSMSRPPVNRPSTGQVQRPTQRPTQRPGNATRPGTGNRPSTLPGGGARPGAGGGGRPGITPGTGPGGRPTTGDLGNFLEMEPPKVSTADRQRIESSFDNFYRDRAATRPGAGGAGTRDLPGTIGDRVPGNIGDRVPGNVSDRMADRGQFRSEFSDNRQDRIQQRQDWADNVRGHWDGDNWHGAWDEFRDDFGEPGWRWEYPRMANAYFRFNHPYAYWWTWSTIAGINNWYPGWWAEPVYYDYGSGGNCYYGDEGVTYGGETVPPEEYAEEVQEQAAAGEEEVSTVPADGSETEWMPLGVFALSTSAEEADPTRYMQLAVSKAGTISGTLHNTQTSEAQPIVGSVDRETQRAAWYAGDKKDVVAETGIYNLTQDSAPVLVHFGKDRTEEYLLIRLPEPPAEGATTPAPATP
jgi:hypothetical protein